MVKTLCELLPFQDKATDKQRCKAIPFELNEYIALVDWPGRAILHNKRGSIPMNTPPILLRLGIVDKDWIQHIYYLERQFPMVTGNIDKFRQIAEHTSRRWIKSMGCAFQSHSCGYQ